MNYDFVIPRELKVGDRVCIARLPSVCADLWHKQGTVEEIKVPQKPVETGLFWVDRMALIQYERAKPIAMVKLDDPSRNGSPPMPYVQAEFDRFI